MNAIEVVGFGALNMDRIYRVERILSDGEVVVTDYGPAPGGSAANTIYGLAKLGVSAGFLGVVGDDEEGRMLLDDFNSVGVDTSHIRTKKAKTGETFCFTDKRGRRAIYVLPGANSMLKSDDIDLGYVSQARILHLSSFADEEQFAIQKGLVDRLPPSVKVSFAPGSIYAAREVEALAPIIKRAHILFLNRREAEELADSDFQAGARRCLSEGCQVVAVTLGPGIKKGPATAICYLVTREAEFMIEAEKTGVRPKGDTIGAGDAFATGFLFGFLRGKGLEECGLLGHLVAHLSTAKVGARGGLPSLSQLRRSYRQLYGRAL
ncbi:MAG: carbohydrate kinase family protein [Chloroflexi bacterium]|nr:MAG: carbohydrate kinase family protein [Chloroflexota bacterium]